MERKKVLIIDDEIDLCLLLKSYFVRKNFEVVLAHSLADGLQKLKLANPEVLFIDNNLPDGTGWNAIQSIIQSHPNIFINLISAYNPPTPAIPSDIKYKIYEKPISFADLDKEFDNNLLLTDTEEV